MPFGGYGGYGYRSGLDVGEILMMVLSVVVGFVIFIVVINIIRKALKSGKGKGVINMASLDSGFMGMRGKTSEQKKIIKYFMSTGILGAIFKISDHEYEKILESKVSEYGSKIANRALEVHGIDANEVRETSPIRIENYYAGSRYFKMFRDLTFRTSEYQMTYLMFGEKQMYAYSNRFDLTSKDTTEQTREYFYEDITTVDVTKEEKEIPNPRPMKYMLGGIGAIILGLIMATIPGAGWFFLLAGVVTGIILIGFLGYSRSVIDFLILRITVAGDEFVCAMNLGNMAAIQGMKAKIREKKK